MNNQCFKPYNEKNPIIIYAFFTLFMVIVLLNKNNYHLDELYSYGLANSMNGIAIQFDDELSYIPAQSPWLSYITVQRGGQFDFQHVWENQATDVHPPFYYLILYVPTFRGHSAYGLQQASI